MTDQQPTSAGSVERVPRLHLAVTDAPWPFAAANRAAIERHWQRRVAENPAFFNGRVFVLRRLVREADGYRGNLSLEAFADFLYWRDHDFPDAGTLDGFGSALVRSVEGHVIAARHAPGTLNGGRVYLPGGFLDARDIGPDGTIDVTAAALRELAEETGLDTGALRPVPGFLVTRHGRFCSFAAELRSSLTSAELAHAMRRGIAASTDRELTEIIVLRNAAEATAAADMLEHARLLVTTVLSETA